MSDYLHYFCRNLDPEEVEKLPTAQKHKARKKIIGGFLFKGMLNGIKNITTDKYEYALVKNIFYLGTGAALFSLFISIFFYRYFFTGVYEFRRFYLNASNIPLIFKLLITGAFGFFVFEKACFNYAYNQDIYEIAIKHMKSGGSKI